ncbi:MAG: hypothetical protein ACLTYW_00875 [Collinsella sp.]
MSPTPRGADRLPLRDGAEAEIVAAIRRRPGAVSVEGVAPLPVPAWSVPGGFCQSRVVAILARELG